MNRIELKINDDKTQTVVTPQPLVEGENLTTEIAVTPPESWVGYDIRCLLTTPKGVLVDAVDASVHVPLTNTMLDGKGTLYVEYVAMKDGTEIARTKSPALLPVSAARSIIGDIDPAPLPDLVAEMVAAKGDCDDAAAAAVLATEQVNAAIEGATSTAVGLCEDQVSLANGYAEDASDSAILAANNILNGLNTHNTDPTAHASIQQDIRTIEAIARGRATAYVFDTLAALNAWVGIPENAAQLVVGDNLYIRALNVKDRWWDGTQIQTLESEAPDLTNYYLKSQVDAMMPVIIGQAAYDALVAAGTVDAGRIYYVTGA